MRIALVHYTAAPIIGGVERVMEEHARLFVANGHEVTVLCFRGGDGRTELLPDGEPLDTLLAVLREALSTQDVVLLHNVMMMPFHPGLTEVLWRVIDELRAVRFVAWLHDVAACNPDYPGTAPIFSRAHPRCEYVAVSPVIAQQFRETTGELEARCRVVPNGIDPARVLGLSRVVAEFARRHDLLDGRLILLHPTRLVRRKNVEMSLAVGREFLRRGTPATALVTAAKDPHNAGSKLVGEQIRREFEDECGHLFVGDHFAVGDEELADLYQLADALLFPSRSEGFGLPLLEAAIHRLPVFCSDIEPLRDLLRENVAHFPHDADPSHVAELIARTVESIPAFRERKRVLREYSWPAIYRRHLAGLLDGR